MAPSNANNASPQLPWKREGGTARVETPEQVEIVYPLAPFGTRIVAALLDYVFLGLANLILFFVFFALLTTSTEPRDMVGYLIAAFGILSFLLNALYFVGFEVRQQGQTPGKKAVGIRTIMDTGQGVTVGAAVLRNLARVVDNLPILWIVPALDRAQRRLGDILAQTLVVRLERERTPRVRIALGDSYAALEQKEFRFSAELYGRVTVEDLNLLEYFFGESRSVRDVRKRTRLARQIAERYQKRLLLADQAERIEEHPVRFLQEFYLFLRDRYERRGF
jgi:uncharacterized RDD family membrane protein YckC